MTKSISDQTKIAVARTDIDYIIKTLDEIKLNLAQNYVTKAEFWPVKTIVYGGAGLILITVLGWLLSTVVKK
jgi:hypothetical protein